MTKTKLIYGLHTVRAFLKHHDAIEIFLQDGDSSRDYREIINYSKKQGIPINLVSKKVLKELSGGENHQGVIARIKETDKNSEDDLFTLVKKLETPAFLLILDHIQDPHNLGACIRCANAAGVHAVIAPKDRASGLTPVVRKVASGGAELIPFIQVTNLARTMNKLQQEGVWIIGADENAKEHIYETEMLGSIAVVVGAEGTGLRRLTKEHCDYLVHIPMLGDVASLNASVAAGVILFEAVRQRMK